MGIFFFTAIRTMGYKQKERITHLYNATVMATAIDEHISTYLSMLPYPKSNLINEGSPQFTSDQLSKIVGFYNYEVLSLEELEKDGLIVSHDDPTARRVFVEKRTYDKKATKVKIKFKLNSNDQVEDIHYLVNLAGSVYEENAPFDSGETFFYLVSFNDDYGNSDFSSYDLTNNEITLSDNDDTIFESVLEVNAGAPTHELSIQLPGDNE